MSTRSKKQNYEKYLHENATDGDKLDDLKLPEVFTKKDSVPPCPAVSRVSTSMSKIVFSEDSKKCKDANENIENNHGIKDSSKKVQSRSRHSKGPTMLSREWVFEPTDDAEDGAPFKNLFFADDDASKCYNYGEPSHYQHLRIDFTPIEGVDDDEELSQKCVGFWNFVNSRPELNRILVKPEKMFESGKTNESSTSSTCNQHADVIRSSKSPQCMTAMEWNGDLPLDSLGKICLEYYPQKESSYKFSSDKSSESIGGSATRFWAKPKKEKDVVQQTYDDKITKKLNAEMEDFDQKHPRRYEPPGVIGTTLIKAEMLRLPPVSLIAPGLYPD
ncbi:hypothetical protein O0L34_g8438 [Tuta absoluta]|nr:hypothetical protein O0L34_g8438 [Tuta absoluta]